MARRAVILVVSAVLAVSARDARSQTAAATPDGPTTLLTQIEKLLLTGDADAFSPLFSPTGNTAVLRDFARDLTTAGVTRAVVRERDRQPLDGTLPGDGYRLVVDFFTEGARRGRIVTARVDVRQAHGGAGHWLITGAERLTSVEGLHRLAIDTSMQFAATNLTIKGEDLELVLQQGDVFLVESADGVTGLVLIGRGEMRFTPTPEAERGQVRIFSGADTLAARFDSAFVRIPPAEYESRVSTASLTKVAVEPRMLRRAQAIFATEAPKSFSLDLSDLSRETWYLLPGFGDLLAEVQTKKYGTLTYARSSSEAEDVTLFDRARHRNIALYASPQKLAGRGRFYDEDDLTDYDVLDQQIDVTISPEREFIEGRSRMRIRVRAYALATMTIRLAEPLTVTGIASTEHGRLLHLRVKNQNSIVVNLPTTMSRDSEMTLVIAYAGRLPSQSVDREALQGPQQPRSDEIPLIQPERHYLLSNRAFWYPQGPVTDYSTATLRVSVPDGFGCVASGEPVEGSPIVLKDSGPPAGVRRQYVFSAPDPLRYLSVVVSRFMRVTETMVPLVEGAGGEPLTSAVDARGRREAGFRVRDRIALTVDANPRQQGRAREMTPWASDILRFYAELIGEAPYLTMSLALVEHELPGGHSPGYFAVINTPLPSTPFVWRNDPAAFTGFPEFFLAHELAHQWWGQAVGWKNYHEQWISEGFAQYFAALYAQRAHGDETFVDMLRQFRRWALAESDEGPVYLGYRLGHIRGDQKVFRALVYNKGAAVLHMLRRLVGDEAFFNGLRRFYYEEKFEKAGTDDLQRAFEAETKRSLERFFERWIYGSALPRLRYATTIAEGAVTVRFEQMGSLLFDVPVTVTVVYADGRSTDVVVPVTEKEVVQKIPVDGIVRNVQVNRDAAAIAYFDQS